MTEEYVDSYEDVRSFRLSDDREHTLLDKQTECCFMWTAKNGDPVGVIMNYVVHDGRFWVTCTAERKRVAALRARPKSCVVVSSEGTWLGGDVTTTAKTIASVHDDRTTKDWFFPALATRQRRGMTPVAATERDEFLRRLDTATRVVIELTPVAWITYDGNRLEAALRKEPYDPELVKPTRNVTAPPEGRVVKAWAHGGGPFAEESA